MPVEEEQIRSVRDAADAVLVRVQRGQRDYEEKVVEYIVAIDTLATARSTAGHQY
jgi:hypothetical protein